MVIDLVVTRTDDGYTSQVPSIKGCETWAHGEEEVMAKSLELVQFYLRIPDDSKILVDKARREGDNTIYKLIFKK